LLGDSSEEALGPMEERTERAAALLEKALEADPDSTAAATRLSQVRTSIPRVTTAPPFCNHDVRKHKLRHHSKLYCLYFARPHPGHNRPF
ncbi:MAG TPA: hypothetical protein VM580_32880, partial [Labilithrix sp.]|nr:hypothetical protein [Labilithrix sp.]